MRRGSLSLNVTTLVSAQVAVKLVNIAISIAVVRYLGAQELGRYAYVLAFAYPFGVLADFGLATFAIREISRDRARELEVVAILRYALLLLAGLGWLALVGLATVIQHDPTTLACLVLAGLSNLLSAATTPSLVLLTAREDLHLLSLQRVAASTLGAIATMTVLLWGGASLALLMAATAVNGAILAFTCVLVGNTPSLPTVQRSAVSAMVRQAIPFGLLMLGFSLYYRVDMVMLHWLRDAREVGLYSAAYRFLDAVMLLAASIGGPFYPRLSNMVGRDSNGVRDLLEGTWKPLLALGLPIWLGTFFVAEPLTRTLFGDEFADARIILIILICGSLPLLWINIPNHALIAANLVWQLAGIYGLSVLVNVAFNLLLIPLFGAAGAGIATVVCEWLNLVLVIRLMRREFGFSLSREGLWRYLVAAVVMAVVLWAGRDLTLILEILLGTLAYVASLLLVGYLRSADLLAVKRLLAQ